MDKHSNTYNHFQTLLKKWRSGAITASEEQQMHKMAKLDPFLADAWEGYSMDGTHDESIDRLKKIITQKSQRKERKIIPYYWLTRAASLIILVGLAFWIFLPSTTKNLSIAMNDKMEKNHSQNKDTAHQAYDIPAFAYDDTEIEQDSEIDFIVKNDTDWETESLDSESSKGFIEDTKKIARANSETGREENNEADIALADESMDQEGKAMNKEPENKANPSFKGQFKTAKPLTLSDPPLKDDTIFSTPLLDASMDLLSQTANMAPPKTINKTIVGQILNEFGEPLIGANVIQEETNQGTITDIDGRFSLTVTDSSNPFLVNYIGYSSKQIPSSKLGHEVKVYLDAKDMVLDEIAVTSYADKKYKLERSRSGSVSQKESEVNNITPKGGEKAFIEYLKKEIIFPADTPKEDTKGLIKLLLIIEEKGVAESIIIKESFNPSINDQIIRLIMEGSKWALSKDQNPGQYIYSFELK